MTTAQAPPKLYRPDYSARKTRLQSGDSAALPLSTANHRGGEGTALKLHNLGKLSQSHWDLRLRLDRRGGEFAEISCFDQFNPHGHERKGLHCHRKRTRLGTATSRPQPISSRQSHIGPKPAVGRKTRCATSRLVHRSKSRCPAGMQSWSEQHSSGYQECPCARKAGAAATNTAGSKMRKAFIGGPLLHVRGHEE